MKKMFIVVAVVAMSVAACGKKKAPAAPMDKNMGSGSMPAGGSDMGSGSGDGSAMPAPGM